MKKCISVALAIFMMVFSVLPVFANSNEIILARGGTTAYQIVIGENATDVEKNAANILQSYLKEITNANFPIVDDSVNAGACEIIVGITNRENNDLFDRSNMGDDGVIILTEGKKLYLTGGEKRGALYSVYTFLEEFLGCRWFTKSIPLTPGVKDCTVIPEINELIIEPIDYTYVPPFKLRQTYWMFSTMHTDFSVAHKLHGMMAGIPEELGGVTESDCINSVHTMQSIITADMFATNPEYFGMDDNGIRQLNRQPCFSNEKVLELTIEAALKHFSVAESIFSVSQNDNQDFCSCPECAAFDNAHGNTDSASLLNFVNKVAIAVKKAYPEARVETLAYQNSKLPPTGINIEENVIIRVCPISTCVLHNLDDPTCPKNAEFDKSLSAWAELTDSIYVWDYSTNFQYIYAFFPNINTIQARYRYFRDRNVVAVFDHGCGENIVPAELHELRTYLVCKLLWNPDTDVQMHIKEFCDAYYGKAADDVIDFINYLENAIKGFKLTNFSTCHMTCQDGGESLENNSSLTEIDVAVLDSIMKRAKDNACTDDEIKHIEGFELSWRFFKNATFAGEFNWFNFRNDPIEESEKLFNDMKAYGVMYLAEAWGVYFGENVPNFAVMPTFWFHAEENLPQFVRFTSKVYPVINDILRVLFAIPNFLIEIF